MRIHHFTLPAREPARVAQVLAEAWPHHAFLTTDACDAEAILAAFAREGWKAERIHNGPPQGGFSLVRGWIENQTPIELGGREMRAEYERFFAMVASRARTATMLSSPG